MRAFLRGGRCFCSSLYADESSSMLSKGRLRETAGTSGELVDGPIVLVAVTLVGGSDCLRVLGGSMIRIFLTSNPSDEKRKKKKVEIYAVFFKSPRLTYRQGYMQQ